MTTHPDWFQRVAHDLRDPLSPLQTAVYLLRNGEIPADERARMLELIERQGVRLANMIDELADCLRAQRGRLLSHRDEVDLATLAMLAVARADAAQVSCEAAPGSMLLMGDDGRLLQLLRILRELRLSPQEVLPAPLIVERVAVEGAGSHARLHRRLACTPDMLAQAELLLDAPLPATLGDGLGLQLPLAAAIVRGHDGELRVVSEPDGRLAVVAELPLLG